jgi:hypothetical protein
MVNNKILVLFTYSFPYGSDETFLENEISFLSSNFKKIVIVPKKNFERMQTITC